MYSEVALNPKPLRIGIIAGEPSGDTLGADLMRSLLAIHPDAIFVGIGGPKMEAQGCQSLFPMEKLSVFGLFEVLKHLPELLGIRKQLRDYFLSEPPDVFIGIDAPDFNLALEKSLHQAGIKTMHYVSPTVWAWRPGRIKKLIGTLDSLLCIFPFEENYFESTSVPAHYIGHPLADALTPDEGGTLLRKSLAIDTSSLVLTLMPGSRMGEVRFHSALFLEVAKRCQQQLPDLEILVPMVNQKTLDLFQNIHQQQFPSVRLRCALAPAKDYIQAADAVLTASGTATLEIMLLARPMVAVYCLSPLSAWIFQTFKLLKTPFVAMPNLIANRRVIPEYLQQAATPEVLTRDLMNWLTNEAERNKTVQTFESLRPLMAKKASHNAALEVIRVARS